MSYDYRLLFERVAIRLQRNPSSSLRKLSRDLRVGRRTIQKAVNVVTGKKFRILKDEFLLKMVKTLLASGPNMTIRKRSLEVGYKTSRSFARAVRRASGFSPQELRLRLERRPLAKKMRA